MKKRSFLFLLLVVCGYGYPQKVGLLIVATGKYIEFVKPLIDSANKYFCTNHDVTYFVFTDDEQFQAPNVIKIDQKKLGWPYDTLMRIVLYDKHKDTLKEMDYLFATDADMLFVDMVGDEILSERVATQHPGYVGRRGTYETRRRSTAYVHSGEGTHYFAGGFNGGSRDEFIKMVRTLAENIQKDLVNNIVAIWHDESHINRYFINNPPTKILTPSYCYSMSLEATNGRVLPYPKRLVALDKNHKTYRS